MITKFANKDKTRFIENGSEATELYGLSTDTKPAAQNGAVFLEMDTKKVYIYDAANETWREL